MISGSGYANWDYSENAELPNLTREIRDSGIKTVNIYGQTTVQNIHCVYTFNTLVLLCNEYTKHLTRCGQSQMAVSKLGL